MSIFQNLFGGKSNTALNNSINQNSFLVDVREPYEFAEGSVKGAVNIPLGSIAANIKSFAGQKDIVVFCRSGHRSAQAVDILKARGIMGVVNGGTWQQVREALANL